MLYIETVMERHLIIQSNARSLLELHNSLSTTGSEEAERLAAITRYFERYDQLAFPGGLTSGMALLAAGDLDTVETAIVFLEADPHFHRSGYIKADLLRYLKRADLSEGQQDRLRRVVLDRVKGPDTREFRRYCRVASVLDTEWFREKLKDFSESPDPTISRHAKWVLRALDHA